MITTIRKYVLLVLRLNPDLFVEEYDNTHSSTLCVCIMYARNILRPARSVTLLRTTFLTKHESQLLQEAIAVARTSGDRVTLQHCVRLVSPPSLVGTDRQ